MNFIGKSLFISFLIGFSFHGFAIDKFQLYSPDKNLVLEIELKPSVHFSLKDKDSELIKDISLSMLLDDGKELNGSDRLIKHKMSETEDLLHPVVAVRSREIKDQYNELVLQFKGAYHIVFRAYDDAVAYRFVTDFRDSITVKNEVMDIQFPSEENMAWFSFLTGKDNVSDRWMNEYQNNYTKQTISAFNRTNKVSELPLLADVGKAKVLITESDLYGYPSLYIKKGDQENKIGSAFPPRVKSELENVKGVKGWDRTIHPKTVYDYIAKTSGKRTFPWRIIAVAKEDIQLLNNEIVYKLAKPNEGNDWDWVRPGLSVWDWWNNWNLTGVDFRAGINNDTYKSYIDFAASNHIPYVIIDDGWYVLGDLTKEVPDMDIAMLSAYAAKKGVGIMLWCSWFTLNKQMKEALDLFQKWGIKGVKVDFMRRDDQDMVNFYWKVARETAKRKMVVDFHGSYLPVGLERTFPNILNYESVEGLENSKWTDKQATPGMAVSIPFIRMFAGPLDYTPGAMRNAKKKDFRAIYDNPMSQGTRCQQLAMYVIYDAPLQMLADNPTAYMREQESLDFIAGVPTTWDKTIPLDGKVGEYVILGRQKDKDFFVGAMTDWEARDLNLSFSFLPEGKYEAVIFQDGINADRNGTDYKKIVRKIDKDTVLKIHLAPGGGWVARVYPVQDVN